MTSRLLLGGLLVGLPLYLGIVVPDCDGPSDGTPTPEPTTPVPTTTPSTGACQVTGCSGQVCASEPVMTTCEYTCEYGCYVYAVCEEQPLGACGWTATDEFDRCIAACSMKP